MVLSLHWLFTHLTSILTAFSHGPEDLAFTVFALELVADDCRGMFTFSVSMVGCSRHSRSTVISVSYLSPPL